MDYLGEGLSDEITNSLARLPDLQVIARSTVSRFESRLASLQEMGRNLNVDAVLTGQVTERGNELDIEAELVNVATGAQLCPPLIANPGEHFVCDHWIAVDSRHAGKSIPVLWFGSM